MLPVSCSSRGPSPNGRSRPNRKKILPLPEPAGCDARLFDVLRQRRSRRNFLAASLDAAQVAGLLATALPVNGPVRANVLLGPTRDLMSGAFEYMPDTRRLAILRPGEDRRNSLARACLGQLWVGLAAMVLALWADLEAISEAGGPRAYRHAMIAAGRAGQRLYLAATALGLGCCGVGAFFRQRGGPRLPPCRKRAACSMCWPAARSRAGPREAETRADPEAAGPIVGHWGLSGR